MKEDIIEIFRESGDPSLAIPMSKYMRNLFPFLGIMTKRRVEISKRYFASIKGEHHFDWDFFNYCFSLPEREFQYLALSYLSRKWRYIKSEDFGKLEIITYEKPWWDSVDSAITYIGHLVKKYPELINEYIYKWMESDNLWQIRWSILFQLKFKKDTDLKILTDAIERNCNTKEFFINKAIGWSLREYAKTDPSWVESYVFGHELSNLSVREALKHIK